MSVAREKIGSLVDHQKSQEIQEEINRTQEKYGEINRKALEKLGYTHETIEEFHEEMNALIKFKCPIKGCEHAGEPHDKILPGNDILLWCCKKGPEAYRLKINQLE
jgi:hypothetical protein